LEREEGLLGDILSRLDDIAVIESRISARVHQALYQDNNAVGAYLTAFQTTTSEAISNELLRVASPQNQNVNHTLTIDKTKPDGLFPSKQLSPQIQNTDRITTSNELTSSNPLSQERSLLQDVRERHSTQLKNLAHDSSKSGLVILHKQNERPIIKSPPRRTNRRTCIVSGDIIDSVSRDADHRRYILRAPHAIRDNQFGSDMRSAILESMGWSQRMDAVTSDILDSVVASVVEEWWDQVDELVHCMLDAEFVPVSS
jgi:hypothetical protein